MTPRKISEKVYPWGKKRNKALGQHCGDPDCWDCEPSWETKGNVEIYNPGKPVPKEWKT
jgi:hypothetical protein